MHIYSLSALSLSYSKNNPVVFFIWGFEQALVFYHKSELSVGVKVGTLVLVSLPKCDP